MKHGSLFSGIGGFDLAAEWMGWENVFHCEWNPFGQKVLKHYWPNTISYNDITTTDFTIHRGSIDILTGGFPCQPYSNAGKRLGKEDERHLWPEMLRAIREIQPRYVVGENVRGLTNWNGGVVFDEVQSDLETQGYEVLPFLLPACAVNAPHRRDRIWFVAHLTNTGSEQFQKWPPKSISQDRKKNKSGVDNRAERSGNTRNAANANEQRPQTGAELQVSGNPEQFAGKQELRSQTKARIHGRSSDEHGFGWNNFPTQPPICSGDDGIPRNMDGITFPKYRQESIKAYGNAIVPQVALQIFKAIQETK